MPKQGLASIGIDVTINAIPMNFVTNIGDIGGAPSTLDATCMKDTMTKSVNGVQEGGTFEVTYLFDNADPTSDYRVLKAAQEKGDVVPVIVTFRDGSKFATTGYVSTYIGGVGVNELVSATATVSLQSEWVVTNPTGV